MSFLTKKTQEVVFIPNLYISDMALMTMINADGIRI